MDLAGRTLGNYQIIEELGRGGMAVVYKAFQPSLGRYVALKVLPEYFQHDPEFIARFQREARAAAQLSHPNIVVIYDVGEQAGVHYIAMEYLDGGSLRDRLEKGALSPQEALRVIGQVGSALDFAHSRGLVHRDIKPANILFSADGRPKVTDFGIARANEGGTRLTRTGVLMGTPEYMSPEQVQGTVVDHRSDLYALGVMLYEMLTGQVPFQGETPHATLYAVATQAPPAPRQVNPGLPPAIEAVILKALAKRPDDRFQRGADMAAALQAAMSRPAVAQHPERSERTGPQVAAPAYGQGRLPPTAGQGRLPPTTGRGRSAPTAKKGTAWVWIVGGAIVVLLAVLAVLLVLAGGGGSEPGPTTAITQVVIVEGPTSAPLVMETPVVEASLVIPTDTPLSSGDLPTAGATEQASDTPTATATAMEQPSDTPTPTPAKNTPAVNLGRLAFSSNRDGNPEIYVIDLASGTTTRLTNNSANDWLPDWSPDGSRIVFTSNRTGSYDLWAMNGDGSGQELIVATAAWDDYGHWSPNGQRLALSTTAKTDGVANSEIHVWSSGGGLNRLTYTQAEDQSPDWSPDGRIIYCEGLRGQSNWDLWVINADGSSATVLVGGPAVDTKPAWSPDGQWIAFIRAPGDNNGNGAVDEEDAGDVWVARADGSGLRQLTSGGWMLTPVWSPDSQWIAFIRLRDSNGNGIRDSTDQSDIWAVPSAGGDAVPLVQGPYGSGDPSWTW
jgi:Tol biopolymer transport system component/predicted Ser/Thr protein kinase